MPVDARIPVAGRAAGQVATVGGLVPEHVSAAAFHWWCVFCGHDWVGDETMFACPECAEETWVGHDA
jgi:rubrerythrin